MVKLREEVERTAEMSYQLSFRLPTSEELLRMRRIHRDMTVEEKERIRVAERGLGQMLDLLESGQIAPENMSPEVRRRIARLLNAKDYQNDAEQDQERD
jgi:superfamily I DNA and RNA helicase